MLGPEVTEGPDGDSLGGRNTGLIEKLLTFDAVVVAGRRRATASRGPSTTCSRTTSAGSPSAHTCSRTARRPSSCPASWTTPTRPTPPSSATPQPACTWSSRRTRSTMADLRDLLLTPEQAAEMDAPGTKDAAVLVPLYDDPLATILTERRSDLRRHAGEIVSGRAPGSSRGGPPFDRAPRGGGGDRPGPRCRRAGRGAAARRHLRHRLPHLPVRRNRRAGTDVAASGERGRPGPRVHPPGPARGPRDAATAPARECRSRHPPTPSTGTSSGERPRGSCSRSSGSWPRSCSGRPGAGGGQGA